jgi:cytochrome c-type biogenesis protein CcmH/NrfG
MELIMQATFKKIALISIFMIITAGVAIPTYAADTTPTPIYAAPQASAFDQSMAQGRAAIKNKNYVQAVVAFNSAVTLESSNADAHTMLAYSYRVQATPNLTKSFEHYDIALKLNPQHKGANEYVGQAYLMDKNMPMARQHLAALEKICGKQCPEYKNLESAITLNRSNNSYGY